MLEERPLFFKEAVEMIEISYVRHEHDKDGKRLIRHDPRRGLSDYTIYTIYTRNMMTNHEMRGAGKYITSLLKAADYEDRVFADVAQHPIVCYASSPVHIKLILFSNFEGRDVMLALASGRKNLER